MQETPNDEEIRALQHLRKRLVVVLSSFKLEIIQDFTVSSAGAQGKGFNLDVDLKKPRSDYAQIVEAIEGEFKEAGICRGSTRSLIPVSLKAAVGRFLRKPEVPPSVIPPSKTEEKPLAPEPVAEVLQSRNKTFLNELRHALEPIIPLAETEKPYILKKYQGDGDTGELQVNEIETIPRILYLLEAHGYKVWVTGTTVICAGKESRTIEAMPDYLNAVNELRKCRHWMRQVREWIEEEQIKAVIVSHPIQIVQSNYESRIVFQSETIEDSFLVETGLCDNSLAPQKIGNVLRLKLNSSSVARPFLKTKPRARTVVEVKDRPENYEMIPTYMSTDYDEFYFIPFNRYTDDDHIRDIIESINEFGIFDFIKIVKTDCIDGVMRKWIVDGQHTFKSEKKKGLPIHYIMREVTTKRELVRLIAVLNNKRKPWKVKDYLNCWAALEEPVYLAIKEWSEKKVSFSIILEALSGKDPKAALVDFKDGYFIENSNANGRQILKWMFDLKRVLPGGATRVHQGVLRFIRGCHDYDHETLVKVLGRVRQRGETFFEAGEPILEITKKVERLYREAA